MPLYPQSVANQGACPNSLLLRCFQFRLTIATPLLEECEDDTHTPEMRSWESSGTLETLKFDCRGQNTSPWGVLHVIGKLLKYRCQKWPRMSHLDIYNISYGKKKGRETNWQFDSRPLKVGNQPDPGVRRWSAKHRWKNSRRATSLLQTSSQSKVWAKSYELTKSRKSKPGQFRDSSLGVPGQKAIRMWVPWSNTKNIIWGKVVASPESRPWWVLWVHSCSWLVLAPKVL
jgi:hypothetical protein